MKPLHLIVRRGALRRFDALTRKTARMPVAVLWDQRTAERRTSSEIVERDRRRSDRRQKPPFTWELADFVVAADAPPHSPPGKAERIRVSLWDG
jgi:hypothetical protein